MYQLKQRKHLIAILSPPQHQVFMYPLKELKHLPAILSPPQGLYRY